MTKTVKMTMEVVFSDKIAMSDANLTQFGNRMADKAQELANVEKFTFMYKRSQETGPGRMEIDP